MADRERTLLSRLRWLAGWINAIALLVFLSPLLVAIRLLTDPDDIQHLHEALPEREPLPDDERPECPHCDRQLITAPGMEGLAWKCPVHGTFPPSEFEANILRALEADMD